MTFHSTPLTGLVVTAPTYRHISGEQGVCKFRLKTSRSVMKDGAWEERDYLFVTVEVWNDLAENVRRSVFKGQRVIVLGNFLTQEYTAADGTPRSAIVVRASAVGHDLTRQRTAVLSSEAQLGIWARSGHSKEHPFVGEDGMLDWIDFSNQFPEYEQRYLQRQAAINAGRAAASEEAEVAPGGGFQPEVISGGQDREAVTLMDEPGADEPQQVAARPLQATA